MADKSEPAAEAQAATSGAENNPHEITSDLYKMTPHVEVAFEDTFKEAESAEEFFCMKTVNTFIYKYTLYLVYGLFSMVIGPLFSFVWGFFFAFTQLGVVWMFQPCIKIFFVMCRLSSMVITSCVRLILDPVYMSMSLMLSNIGGRIKVEDTNLSISLKQRQIEAV